MADVAPTDLPPLGLFSLAYAHLLLVLDDAEFFDAQKPFTLGEQRGIAVAVNTLVVRSHLSRGSGFGQMRGGSARLMEAAARLLRGLQTRDSRRPFAPPGLWLAPAAAAARPISVAAAAAALTVHLGLATPAGDPSTGKAAEDSAAAEVGAGLLVDCPHALPFHYRVQIFRQLVHDDRLRAGYRPQAGGVDADENQGQGVRPVAEITVRRGRLLEDAISQILPLGATARGRLAVRFTNAAGGDEAGIDAGGLFKELLSEISSHGFNPERGVFTATAGGLVHPSSGGGDSHEGIMLLELIGMMVGKGLYEGLLQEVQLAPFFAKALLGIPRTLDDLPSLDPELHRSLVQVLRYDGEVADLCLDWTVQEECFGAVVTHELRPNGANVEVTNENRLGYVHAVADFHLNRRSRNANNAFLRGLSRIVAPGWLQLFGVRELSLLMSGGDADVDTEDLRRHTVYSGGYSKDSRSVAMFWEAVTGFSPEERRALLKFVTSSARPPVQGFRHLHPPFTIHKVGLWLMAHGLWVRIEDVGFRV